MINDKYLFGECHHAIGFIVRAIEIGRAVSV
jgi:hypothetical protein